MSDVVRRPAEAAKLPLEPLLVLEPLEDYIESVGLGRGPVVAEPIGDGHSNITYQLRTNASVIVLRRPPRGELPPSAHDVVREARLLQAVGALGTKVPEVLAICEDRDVIGAPFYLMDLVDGQVLSEPSQISSLGRAERARLADEVVDNLAAVHRLDVADPTLAGLGRPDGFLQRQVRRFGGLLERNATRPLPDLEWLAEWLPANAPASERAAVVHGDYRLGNLMFAPGSPRLIAILDWELATLGDPLADLGYLTASWARSSHPENVVNRLSSVTLESGFPDAADLAVRYAAATGASVAELPWYEALALWRAAIFLEGSYRRFLAGTTPDAYFAELEAGVPRLGEIARGIAQMCS
jgi:aminoglycoside phosphotransferase (APT) family kinase protein